MRRYRETARMAETMNLRSPAFSDHTLIPDRYSHDNGDVPPPLMWTDVPEGTAELALVCEDPDAPGGTFVHWLLAGIPPELGGLADGRPPENAAAGSNGYDAVGYGGPNPPIGDDPHRYFLRLYALPEPSGLAAGFTAEDLSPHTANALAKGTLVGMFGK
jgi:Raf kinase inhibitor-like YbhB/YbcL family protein